MYPHAEYTPVLKYGSFSKVEVWIGRGPYSLQSYALTSGLEMYFMNSQASFLCFEYDGIPNPVKP